MTSLVRRPLVAAVALAAGVLPLLLVPASVASAPVGAAEVSAAPVAAAPVATAPVATPGASTVPARAARPRAVVARRVIGRSVRGRPITAWRLGERGKKRIVLISTMHGNEPATRQILTSLRDGRRIKGVDLWVIPTYNPDGLARGTRRNARGVDLNRNFPHNWRDLDGSYESGRRPGSEPETRAVMRFLRRTRPARVISFHQPLHGVDTDTKDRRFARRLARGLRLPRKNFDCGGVCHGTMTSWFNANFRGAALTVEYGARPGPRLMRRKAPRQLLKVLRARRVKGRAFRS